MGKANFGISLENPNEPISAGSRLKGFVFCDIQKEITGSEMTVQLLGQEKTCVQYTTHHGKETHTNHAYASRNIISMNLPVESLQMIQAGRIPAGKYQLNFDMELPTSLPSTMSRRSCGSYFKIYYLIKAILKGSGTFWDYKVEQPVLVKSKPLETEPLPYSAPPVTKEVRLCCCLHRGHMTFGTKVMDTRLDRQESTAVNMSCRNNTTVRVKRVEAKLMEQCKWKARGHPASNTTVLSTIDFGDFSGLERKNETSRGISDYEREEIYREIEAGTHSGSLSMPMNALSSYQGAIVTVQHWIDVGVVTGCCIDNPAIHIPVQCGEAPGGGPPAGGDTQDPIVIATPVPEGFSNETTMSDTIYVPSSAATMGGSPVYGAQEEDVAVSPLSEPSLNSRPSFDSLIKEMEESVADLDIIRNKINDPEWKGIFQGLSTSDFAKIIQQTDSDFDQPIVAATVAREMFATGSFTCDYVVAALRATSEWNRSAIVEKLLEYCQDLASNQQLIKNELSDWEIMCTERAFAEALNN